MSLNMKVDLRTGEMFCNQQHKIQWRASCPFEIEQLRIDLVCRKKSISLDNNAYN